MLILNKNKWGLAVQVFNPLIPGKCGLKKEIYFQWYNIWHSELVKFVNHKYDMINDLLKLCSPVFYRIAILKSFISHKNVMELFFKIKTFIIFKEVMEYFSILKTLKAARK